QATAQIIQPAGVGEATIQMEGLSAGVGEATMQMAGPPVGSADTAAQVTLPVVVPSRATPAMRSGSETVIAPGFTKSTPSLIVSSNIHSERQVYLLDKPVQNIGRDLGNEIAINEPIVSAWHLQIIREGGKLFLL